MFFSRAVTRGRLVRRLSQARPTPDSTDTFRSIPTNITSKIGTNLHLQPHHPLNNIKQTIEANFPQVDAGSQTEGVKFHIVDSLDPYVSVRQNFDDLLTPKDHVSRSTSDTFYVDNETVLRTHTSAHQTELIRSGHQAFLCTGDVYRRDTVDASHSPVFHQMEGVRIFGHDEISPLVSRESAVAQVQNDLKQTLEGLVRSVFGDVEVRWVDAYFPFTEPSMEMEIYFQDEWLEVLGCGVIEQEILEKCGKGDEIGWAFGLGLERLAMVLYGIPDIRLFWSHDDRFLSQFEYGRETKFASFSKYPPCMKDVSFWTPSNFHENDMHDAARNVAGDLVEEVKLIDQFDHPKTGQTSHCYRVVYRSMERNLTNEEVDALQEDLRVSVTRMGGVLR